MLYRNKVLKIELFFTAINLSFEIFMMSLVKLVSSYGIDIYRDNSLNAK